MKTKYLWNLYNIKLSIEFFNILIFKISKKIINIKLENYFVLNPVKAYLIWNLKIKYLIEK